MCNCNLRLVKRSLDLNLAKVYVRQLIEHSIWCSEAENALVQLGKEIEELTEADLSMLFPTDFHVGLPPFVYYFDDGNEITEYLDGSEYPILFTNVLGISYDMGGLLKLQLCESQNYSLYSFMGDYIFGPCNDLELLANAKFMARQIEDEMPVGFCVYQITKNEDTALGVHTEYNVELVQNLGEYNFLINCQLTINGRDTLDFENLNNGYLQNSLSREAAKEMLLTINADKITSRELRSHFRSDIELAAIAILRNHRAYTLLDKNIQENPVILRLLFFNCNSLNKYIVEYNMNPLDFLHFDEIVNLIKNNSLSIYFLPQALHTNRLLLEAAARNDEYFLQFVDICAPHLKKDQKLMCLAAVSREGIFNFVDNELLSDRGWIESVLTVNFANLRSAPDFIKSDFTIVQEALLKNLNQLGIFFVTANDAELSQYSQLLVNEESLNTLIKLNFQQESEYPF
jgi:hypothetical protein